MNNRTAGLPLLSPVLTQRINQKYHISNDFAVLLIYKTITDNQILTKMTNNLHNFQSHPI